MDRTIGIVGGTGPEGLGLAFQWIRAGEKVLIGSRDSQRAADAAANLRVRLGPAAQIQGSDNSTVVSTSDVIVLTVPFAAHSALLKQLKPAWKPGTVVIDTTVPLAASVGGSPARMLGVWQGSAAEQARELLPPNVQLAAALHNVGAELLVREEPVDCDVLVCSDHETAKRAAMELASKIAGARAIDGGKLENARFAESLTALLIGLNIRYKVHGAGIRFTGLPF